MGVSEWQSTDSIIDAEACIIFMFAVASMVPALIEDTAMAEADCCASNHRINKMTLTAGFIGIAVNRLHQKGM